MDFKLDYLTGFAGLAVIGTVFGMIFRGWEQIKAILQKIFHLFVIEITIEDNQTSQAILAYLIKHYRRSNMGVKTFGGKFEVFRNGNYGHVPYEFFGEHSLVFWNGVIPFWFVITVEKQEKSYYTSPTIKSSVYLLRFTIDVENVVKQASQERNNIYWATTTEGRRRFFIKRIPDSKQDFKHKFSVGTSLAWYYEGIYRLLSHKPIDLGNCSNGNNSGGALSKLYFPPKVMSLVEEIKLWRNLRVWYEERAIPWKRGWLLYGNPGTGKSAIVRAIAEDLDMPLFVFSLGHMIDDELESSWFDMQAHSPCIALFEDFDNVFNGRNNVCRRSVILDGLSIQSPTSSPSGTVSPDKQKTEQIAKSGLLNFDCLLNCIDGVEHTNGIFTIITTNHIEKIDIALGVPVKNEDGTTGFVSTRPGRIDKAIELTFMTVEDKLKLARRILFDNDDAYLKVKKMVEQENNKKETPAQFQEKCSQIALQCLWNNENPKSETYNIVGNGYIKDRSSVCKT